MHIIPMDVNATNAIPFKKLMPEEHAQHLKEGHCFPCHQQGHMAKECLMNKKGSIHTNTTNDSMSTNTTNTTPLPITATTMPFLHLPQNSCTHSRSTDTLNLLQAM